jgi:hypothetical protein
MVALDNDLFPAVELTGMARAEAELLDSSSLARWLPNVPVDDIAVSFVADSDGNLIDEAQYRAFDAEPDFGRGDEGGEELMVKLPAISKQATISEYQQLRARNAGEAVLRNKIEQTMRTVVRSIVLRANSQRANVLVTGRAFSTGKFRFSDDFGRDAALTTAVPTPWSDTTTSRLAALETLRDLYASKQEQYYGVEEEPGAILLTRTGFSALMRGNEFRQLMQPVAGPESLTRPPTQADVLTLLQAYGLPPIYTVTGIPDDTMLMLPAPGAPNAGEAGPLGATYWGRTLAASEAEWEIDEEDQAGIICGVFSSQGIPPIKFVAGDSISLPVALNANRSLAATIL